VFVPVAKEELDGHVWHEDVGVYSVWEGDDQSEDPAGGFIGYLYTDLLVRDGKYHGNQNVGLQSVSWPGCIVGTGGTDRLRGTSGSTAAGYFQPQP